MLARPTSPPKHFYHLFPSVIDNDIIFSRRRFSLLSFYSSSLPDSINTCFSMEFHQRDLGEVQDRLDAVFDDASKPTNSRKRKRDYTTKDLRNAINTTLNDYTPPIIPPVKNWAVTDQSYLSYSPVQLFLLLCWCVLEILLHYTNLAIERNTNPSRAYQPVTMIEIRRWIACRLSIFRRVPFTSDIDSFWSSNDLAAKHLSRNRYYEIEHYLTLNSNSPPSNNKPVWFWRVADAMDALRAQLKRVFIPPTYIAVDESTVKFSGRSKHTYLTPHKPAREGFVFYALVGQNKLMLDFLVTSPVDGIEVFPRGITIDIPTRETRQRKKGTIGATATTINLPTTKGLVYTLCERFLRLYQDRQFICFCDNLFCDPHLARALMTINVGLCGTVRKNARDIPEELAAIANTKPVLLNGNQLIYRVVDNILITVWRDSTRSHTVTMLSNCHSPKDMKVVSRKHRNKIEYDLRSGFSQKIINQPSIAVDYNNRKGLVDHFNQLRQSQSIYRPH